MSTLSRIVSQKMKDKSGASITVALLFFMMCAIVSSILIATATAASGKIKQLESKDAGYYSVVSAAELLRDEIMSTNSLPEETRAAIDVSVSDGTASAAASLNDSQSDLNKVLSKSIAAAYNNASIPVQLTDWEIQNSDKDCDINAAFVINANYSDSDAESLPVMKLSARFSSGDTSVSLTMNGTPEFSSMDSGAHYIYKWEDAQISSGTGGA